MTTWREHTVDVEIALDTYRAELKKLDEINAKNDWTAAGNEEFRRQSDQVWWAKEAVILAQNRTVKP